MRTLYCSLFLLITLASCQDLAQLSEVEDVTYNAEFAFPLLNSSITLKDALEELDNPEEIRIGEDGLLTIVYRGSLIAQESEDILTDLSATLPPIIPILSDSFALPFSIPGQVDIDEIRFSGGDLSYTFQHNHPEPINVSIRIPQLLLNGEPLTYELTVPGYTGEGPRPTGTNEQMPTDLSQVRIIPDNDQVVFIYQAEAEDGTPVNLTNFFLRLNSPTVSYAEGYLGQNIYEGGEDVIDIDFFDLSYINGQILFTDPSVTFFVENSYGIPTRAVINDFSVTTTDGTRLPVQGDLIDQGIDFPYPGLNQVGVSLTDSFTFNRENSNVDEVLSSNPRSIAYNIDLLTHPEGDQDVSGFVRDDNTYSVRMQVELPMRGQVFGFGVRDTAAVAIGDLEEVEEAEIKIIADNEIPVDADLQLYFLDEAGQLLDSLLATDQQRLQAALMLPDGTGTTATTTEVIIPIDADRFETIKDVTSAILTIRLSTQSNANQAVSIFQDQKIGVRIGMKASVRSN